MQATEMIQTDDYGTVQRRLYSLLDSHNVPPAMYSELVDYFGPDATAEIMAYVKSKGRSRLNYGDVHRDRPARPERRATQAVDLLAEHKCGRAVGYHVRRGPAPLQGQATALGFRLIGTRGIVDVDFNMQPVAVHIVNPIEALNNEEI